MNTIPRRLPILFVFILLSALTAIAFAQPPGLPVPASTSPNETVYNDQKPGSVLLYNFYASNTINPAAETTEISITNTHPTDSVSVHFFMADGVTGLPMNGFTCLAPLQTKSFLASDIDPGVRGWIAAVAVSSAGCPINFNHLIGDVTIKLASGHTATLNAIGVAALNNSLTACNAGTAPGTIFSLGFDGLNYNRLPRVLSVPSIRSSADGNNTRLIVNRIGGNLGTLVSTGGTVTGTLFDAVANPYTFTTSFGPQLFTTLSNSFPALTAPATFTSVIPAGSVGHLKLFNATTDAAYLGAVLNFNPNAGTNASAYNGGSNLPALTLANVVPLFLPAIPPVCNSTINFASDLEVTSMTASASAIQVGNNLTYTVNVRNNGFSRTRVARLTNTLPAGVNYVSATFTQGSPTVRPCTQSAGTITCNFLAMSLNETATATIVVTPTTANPALTNTVSVSTLNRPPDPDTANNMRSVTTTVTSSTAPTTTTLTTSVNPSVYGELFVRTVTVTPNPPATGTPTGTVTFKVNGTVAGTVTLSGGTASSGLRINAVGSLTLTAEYSGDASFQPSTGTLVQTVNQAATQTIVVSSAPSAVFGQPVALTATVAAVAPGSGTPTGTVEFFVGATSLGTASLSSGSASIMTPVLSVGAHPITAVYSGSGNFLASNSSTLNQVVSQAATATSVVSSLNPSNPGEAVTFTATVNVVAPGAGTPSGTVQFMDGATPLGSPMPLSSGNTSLSVSSLASGSHNITAVYSGSGEFGGSASAVLLQGVSASAPTVSGADGTQTAQVTVDASTITTTFANGSTGGTTTVAPLSPTDPALSSLPGGFAIDNTSLAYEITTTANTGGQPITLCFEVPAVNDEAVFNSLTIIHYVNGQPVIEPTTRNFAERTLCTTVTSLSPFVIARLVSQQPLTLGAIVAPIAPVPVNNLINVSAVLINPDQVPVMAVFAWGDGSTSPGSVVAGTVSDSHSYATPGVYTVKLTVTDNTGNAVESVYRFVVVYDPSGGFVTGGGWINSPAGAYVASPSLTGKANFGFESKYKKGTSIPAGQTQFDFKVADLKFHSTDYEWLVVAGARAQFKGVGTINGFGNYGFLLTAIDGQISGGGGVDKFRIKIWNKSTGEVIYDNQFGAADDSNAATALGGGSIVIHK